MTFLAFVSAPVLSTTLLPCQLSLKHSARNLARSRRPCRRVRTPRCASSRPDPGQGGTSAEDDKLSLELRNKVNELFGGRQNVSIEMENDSDSGIEFNVRVRERTSEYQQAKAAWNVIGSVAVVSLLAGIAFTALYYSGAVHGSPPPNHRHEMPTYGKTSYINPYELLEEDRAAQEATENVQHP